MLNILNFLAIFNTYTLYIIIYTYICELFETGLKHVTNIKRVKITKRLKKIIEHGTKQF